MKRCITICVLTWLGLMVASAAAEPVTIAQDGKAVATIMLPMQTEYERHLAGLDVGAKPPLPGDEEVLAAEELQSIIRAISGADLPIERVEHLNAIGDKTVILVGSALARQAGAGEKLDALHADGLLIAANGRQVILSGRRARGTLYAVYELLEELGCRWVMPGEFGALYPSLPTVTAAINKVENPSHDRRYWWCTYGHAEGFTQWTLRNKMNFVHALGDPNVRQGHALAQALNWGTKQDKYKVNVVRTKRVKQVDEAGNEHWVTQEEQVVGLPDDFYAMTNGTINTHVPNMANPKVWNLYADYYIDYFNKNPDEKYASASAEDGFVNDERATTRMLDSKEIDFAMGAPSATDRFLFFLNRIMERVERVHPDRKLGVLVYSNNLASPRLEHLHSNVALVFAPLGVSPLHDVRDPKSKTNRWYRQWLEDWMLHANAVGAETYYYDYEPMGYCWNMAMICPRWAIIGKNYPWFHEMGLDGHTSQGYDDWAACGLDNYLMARLYWDVNVPYHKVIADYCQARFGAAGEAMEAYYRIYEDRMAEIPDLYSNEYWANHLILTPPVRAAAREQLQEAVKLADSDRARAHLHTMVLLQESTDAMCDGIEHAHATGNFAEAAAMMDRCFDIAAELNEHYPNFMNSTRVNREKTSLIFTGGLVDLYNKIDAKVHGAKAHVLTPRMWKGMLDTRNHAWALGYHKPDADVSKLEDLDVTVCPDVKYQTQRDVAAYFYRTQVDVPQDFADKTVTLYFPAIIARNLQIWINGQPVEFDVDFGDGVIAKDTIWRGPDYFWYNYDHGQEFDVTPLIKPGQINTIAMRVYKAHDFGGTYRRVFLLGN